MNIDEYISSGVLEAYAMGTASEQEMQEVECMSHIYPEIAAELELVQQSMESYVRSHSVAPPELAKENIMAAIDKLDIPAPEKAAEEESETPVISIEKEEPKQKSNLMVYVAAASLAALAFMAYSYFMANSELDKANKQLTELQDQQKDVENLQDKYKERTVELAEITAKYESMAGVVSSDLVILKGLETKLPDISAAVLWDKNSGMVRVNPGTLPTPEAGKQYQLWAIVNGAPVDMGVFNMGEEKLIDMKVIGEASAFAITLEKEGGVPSPTMEEMYVLGTV